jgi:N utilization substance protein A
MRVKAVMEELSWEKIDIIPNDEDIREVIKRSLTPANVINVEINEEEESATVYIPTWDRARAVWRNWINVNLASKLVWYRISLEEVDVEENKKENSGENTES